SSSRPATPSVSETGPTNACGHAVQPPDGVDERPTPINLEDPKNLRNTTEDPTPTPPLLGGLGSYPPHRAAQNESTRKGARPWAPPTSARSNTKTSRSTGYVFTWPNRGKAHWWCFCTASPRVGTPGATSSCPLPRPVTGSWPPTNAATPAVKDPKRWRNTPFRTWWVMWSPWWRPWVK